MIDQQEIAILLAQVITTGILAFDELDRSAAMAAAEIEGELRSVHFSREGLLLLDRLVAAVRADSEIAHQVRAPDARREVQQVIVEGTIAHDEGRLNAADLVATLLDRLQSGRQQWTSLQPVPGLVLPAGTTLPIAGMIIGGVDAPAITQEIAAFRERLSQFKADLEMFDRRITFPACWAISTATARDDSAQLIMAEQLALALDILRSFAPYIGINPDTTLLGDVSVPGWRYSVAHNESGGFTISDSANDTRRPYDLNEELLAALQHDALFARASTIAASDARTEMEDKLIWGIRFFGHASRTRIPEAKVQSYLTVLETVLAPEGTEYRNRGRKIARRLTLFIASADGEPISEVMDRLYDVRSKHVHHGYTGGLRGQDVATLHDVEVAQGLAYRGLRIALHESEPYETRAAFVEELDRRCGVAPS